MIVTFKEDKHLREKCFAAAANHATQGSNGSGGPGPPDGLSFVDAVCVCLCLPTETNQSIFIQPLGSLPRSDQETSQRLSVMSEVRRAATDQVDKL